MQCEQVVLSIITINGFSDSIFSLYSVYVISDNPEFPSSVNGSSYSIFASVFFPKANIPTIITRTTTTINYWNILKYRCFFSIDSNRNV